MRTASKRHKSDASNSNQPTSERHGYQRRWPNAMRNIKTAIFFKQLHASYPHLIKQAVKNLIVIVTI